MPFYEFECYDCRKVEQVMTSIEKRDEKQPCKKCGVPMERMVGMGYGC